MVELVSGGSVINRASQWFRLVDLTNLDRFGGKKSLNGRYFFGGERYPKTKTSSKYQLFKDFKITAVNIECKKHIFQKLKI